MPKTWEAFSPSHDALEPNLVVDLFDVWGIDFMGPFPVSFGYSYILVGLTMYPSGLKQFPAK